LQIVILESAVVLNGLLIAVSLRPRYAVACYKRRLRRSSCNFTQEKTPCM
jgi:hypothetical protein